MTSANGGVTARMQPDGNFVVRGGGGVIWHTGTNGYAGATLSMQSDGNLVVRDSTGQARWDAQTAGRQSAYMGLQDDGNVVLRDSSGRLVWESTSRFTTLFPGYSLQQLQPMYGPASSARVELYSNGNLTSYGSTGKALWSSDTAEEAPHGHVDMQTDGNLVIRTMSGTAVWTSGTAGHSGAVASVDRDGYLSVGLGGQPPLWTNRPTTTSTARRDTLTRAATWLTAINGDHVPYDQEAVFQGHRTDCSGYASMALGYPPQGLGDPNTVALATSSFTRPITMSELLPGDLVIDSTGPSADIRHVVIFEKWTDSSHTAYWTFEQAGSTNGTAHRTHSYGFGGDEFLPRRPNSYGD
ncbi:hypothetical protein ACOCJ7_14770 [Knoellia sp. CPCC 206453]|uniref:hypothetical protein n=1 Tax=Knoellia pratensis TaxID=3404796 RepID=UPI00360C696C